MVDDLNTKLNNTEVCAQDYGDVASLLVGKFVITVSEQLSVSGLSCVSELNTNKTLAVPFTRRKKLKGLDCKFSGSSEINKDQDNTFGVLITS